MKTIKRNEMAEKYARKIAQKPRPGRVLVTVSVSIDSLPIAHAIAAAVTAENYQDETPCTVEEVLEMALEEGLALNENESLETNSLGGDQRGEQDRLRNASAPMLALVRAAIAELGFGEMPKTDQQLAADLKKMMGERADAATREEVVNQ